MRSTWLAPLLLVVPAAFAHHSAAMFDSTKTLTLEGRIERYEWANPHVYVHLATSSGVWIIEAGSPSLMQRSGWTPDSLAAGDAVAIDVNPVRDTERRMARGIVVRPEDGPPLDFRRRLPADPRSATPAEGLDGNWLPRVQSGSDAFVGEPTGWSLTAKGLEALASSEQESGPGIDCVALQAPFQMAWTELKNVELAGDTVILRTAVNVGVERIVHLDQTTHAGAPFTNEGHSIGRWDNGTLVVDTQNFSDHPSGNRGGLPSGSQKHLVEYFELSADRTTLAYRFRLEDPEYLAAPFEGAAVWEHRPDLPYRAEECNLESARRYLEER
jgi:hypothetical protein